MPAIFLLYNIYLFLSEKTENKVLELKIYFHCLPQKCQEYFRVSWFMFRLNVILLSNTETSKESFADAKIREESKYEIKR